VIQRPHGGARSTTIPTIRRTSGNTNSSVGNATSHDSNHAIGHVEKNASLNPIVFSVDTADTIIDITIESTTGITIAAYRAGKRRRLSVLEDMGLTPSSKIVWVHENAMRRATPAT
jgi:hypothetical protein